MDLGEIFKKAKNKLTPAELNFYFAFLSIVNDEGEALTKLKTVADIANLHYANASTFARKLEKNLFIQKTKNGYLCLVGVEAEQSFNNFSQFLTAFSQSETVRQVLPQDETQSFNNFSQSETDKKQSETVPSRAHARTHSLLVLKDIEKEEEESLKKEKEEGEEFVLNLEHSSRNISPLPRNDDLGQVEAVQIFESTFDVIASQKFAETLQSEIKNTSHWKQFLITKIACADYPQAKRDGIQRWILKDYGDYCVKHPLPKKEPEYNDTKLREEFLQNFQPTKKPEDFFIGVKPYAPKQQMQGL